MFWGDESLKSHGEEFFHPYSQSQVRESCYRLRLGDEVFISPITGDSWNLKRLHQLNFAEPISIPPGRFAFLITREWITLPKNVLGFISLRSRYKMQGLINVSGFHVDPSYSGKLIFAVFNAGTKNITVRCDDELFSIWIASTDASDSGRGESRQGYWDIPSDLVSSIPEATKPIDALERRLNELERKVDSVQVLLTTAIALAIAIIAAIVSKFIDVGGQLQWPTLF